MNQLDTNLAPSLQEILRELSPAERDALIVLVNHYRALLTAQEIRNLMPTKPLLVPFQTIILRSLVHQKLVTQIQAGSGPKQYQVAPGVMKLVRE